MMPSAHDRFVSRGLNMWLLWVLACCFLVLAGAGCQSVRNATTIYVSESSTATITSDGGSASKPVDVARGLKATLPVSPAGM